jgi:hypothetical protein
MRAADRDEHAAAHLWRSAFIQAHGALAPLLIMSTRFLDGSCIITTAREAEDRGLLTPSRLEALLRAEVQRRKGTRSFEAAERLDPTYRESVGLGRVPHPPPGVTRKADMF